MAWIGQPWKLMAPVVTDVGQDWPTSATDGAAYLAHGREFCENFYDTPLTEFQPNLQY